MKLNFAFCSKVPRKKKKNSIVSNIAGGVHRVAFRNERVGVGVGGIAGVQHIKLIFPKDFLNPITQDTGPL